MKLIRVAVRLLLTTSCLALFTMGVGCIALLAAIKTGNYQVNGVLTGSMEPTIPTNSLVLAERTPREELHTGDVIMYYAPISSKTEVMHRVTAVQDKGATTEIRTKGDANSTVDPWIATISAPDVWIVKHHLPGLGVMNTNRMAFVLLFGSLLIFTVALNALLKALSKDTGSASAKEEKHQQEKCHEIQA